MVGIPSCDFTTSTECCMPNSKVFTFFMSTFYFKVMVDFFLGSSSAALLTNGSITFVLAMLATATLGVGLLAGAGIDAATGVSLAPFFLLSAPFFFEGDVLGVITV